MHFIIYETKNLVTGKIYVGCHQTNNLEDGYLGSGSYFKKSLRKYGKENFERKILLYCKDFEEMKMMEALIVNETFIKRKDTYNLKTGGLNNGILCKESKEKIAHSVSLAWKEGKYDDVPSRQITSEETKIKISEALKSKYELNEHHSKGKDPWNKGKKTEKASWNKGKKQPPMDKQQKEKISVSLRKRYLTEDHHLKGKQAHNKGKKTGKPSWNSGITLNKDIECPHCKFLSGSISNMKRWHFDNCKMLNNIERF